MVQLGLDEYTTFRLYIASLLPDDRRLSPCNLCFYSLVPCRGI